MLGRLVWILSSICTMFRPSALIYLLVSTYKVASWAQRNYNSRLRLLCKLTFEFSDPVDSKVFEVFGVEMPIQILWQSSSKGI